MSYIVQLPDRRVIRHHVDHIPCRTSSEFPSVPTESPSTETESTNDLNDDLIVPSTPPTLPPLTPQLRRSTQPRRLVGSILRRGECGKSSLVRSLTYQYPLMFFKCLLRLWFSSCLLCSIIAYFLVSPGQVSVVL